MESILEIWRSADRDARIGMAAGVAFAALFVAAGAWWLLSEEKVVLFSGLDAREAAEIVEQLEQRKVEFELADGGTTIRVPASAADETRVKLMGEGLAPGGGVGFEVFDDSEFGMTEFAQRVNFQRAMQGELARTIGALDEVRHARVHLVMPEKGLFGRRGAEPSASVNLTLQRGRKLGELQVAGIQQMVSAAVEGLGPEQVTVVDQDGLTLSRGLEQGADMAALSARFGKKREVESHLRAKLEAILGAVPGGDLAIVNVDVTLHMDEVKRTLQQVVTRDDGSGWVKSRRESRSWSGVEEATADGGTTTETEYDLGRRIEEVIEKPGAIARLSVGVLLPAGLAPGELEKLREVIEASVGMQPGRGDVVSVHAMDWAALPPLAGAPNGKPPATEAATVLAGARLPLALPALSSLPDGLATRLALAAGVAALAIVGTGFAIGRRRTGAPERTAAAPREREREEILAELRGWIGSEALEPEDAP